MTDVFSLKPGDVVDFVGESYVVEARAAYSSAAVSWEEWTLNPGRSEGILAVVAMQEQTFVGADCKTQGDEQAVSVEGEEFALRRQGRADVRTETEHGPSTFDRARFRHYAGPEGRWLVSTESHAGSSSILLTPVEPGLFDVFSV